MRSLAWPEILAHSLWWNSYLPACMLLNRLIWQRSQAPPWAHPQSDPQLPEKGGYPHSKMYIITPSDQRSHLLSYLKSSSVSSMKASTISGAMNSALPTGVSRRGVVSDPPPEWNFIPEPRSKSQSLTGVSWSLYTQRTFSGFRSLCAIPFEWRNSRAEATSVMILAASCSVKNFLRWM